MRRFAHLLRRIEQLFATIRPELANRDAPSRGVCVVPERNVALDQFISRTPDWGRGHCGVDHEWESSTTPDDPAIPWRVWRGRLGFRVAVAVAAPPPAPSLPRPPPRPPAPGLTPCRRP